jgi:hypothetical protein
MQLTAIIFDNDAKAAYDCMIPLNAWFSWLKQEWKNRQFKWN